jgi:tetratricopeptide (TPR) repeat protein
MGRAVQAAAAREKVGAVLATTAQYDAALEVYGQAAQTWAEAGDLESLARVTAGIGSVYASNGTPEEGVQHLRPLLQRLEEQGHERGLDVLYPIMARLYLTAGGRYDEVLAAADRAIALARASRDDRLWARRAGRVGAGDDRVHRGLCPDRTQDRPGVRLREHAPSAHRADPGRLPITCSHAPSAARAC